MSLWSRMQLVTNEAVKSAAAYPIKSDLFLQKDDGIDFVVRYAPDLKAKPKTPSQPPKKNPFLPPESGLFVDTIGDHHQLILNKFNVLPLHGLLITNEFVEQTDLLTLADFAAVACLLNEADGLVFYNGGRIAGASQTHRHFQLVPKDLGFGEIPIERAVQEVKRHQRSTLFPFQHRLFFLPNYDASTLWDAWTKLEYNWTPYNLLLTRQWMLVVPRSQEAVAGMQINSLGLAGALLVKNLAEQTYLSEQGPMQCLRKVCCI